MFYFDTINGKKILKSDFINGNAECFFTTRETIIKTKEPAFENLVEENKNLICDFLKIKRKNLISPKQTHTSHVEIAKEGKGIYVRVDNSNSAQKAINQEVNKMAKSDVESKVYTEFNEQFQAIAWVILLLLLAEILILDRKNPLFKNIHLFSNKK